MDSDYIFSHLFSDDYPRLLIMIPVDHDCNHTGPAVVVIVMAINTWRGRERTGKNLRKRLQAIIAEYVLAEAQIRFPRGQMLPPSENRDGWWCRCSSSCSCLLVIFVTIYACVHRNTERNHVHSCRLSYLMTARKGILLQQLWLQQQQKSCWL